MNTLLPSVAAAIAWSGLFLGVILILAYRRASLAAATAVLAVPLLLTFDHTHKVPRLPTGVLVTGLMVMAFLSLAAGLILDTVTRGRHEAKVLRYLAVPGPLVAGGADPANP